jgi:glycosyltransferase involved in cell wall biosynthesis
MISVVIATRDRAELLKATLESLRRQESPGCPVEILIVDNGSIDATPDVVASAARLSRVPIVYLTESKPGKSHALNTAAGRARGDIVVFTDDDVLPSPGWLSAYARSFSETGADYAVGRILPYWEAMPPRWLSPELYGVLAIPDGGTRRLRVSAGMNEHIMPLGANMAVRRHVLDRVGGWNPELGKLKGTSRTGEDHEFALRVTAAGYAGIYEPQASVLHRVPADRLRLGYFLRWYYDNGGIEAGLEQDYPSTEHYVLSVPRYRWRMVFTDLGAAIFGALTGNAPRATAGVMRLAWFAGYVRGRWTSRRNRPAVGIPAETRS